MRFPCNLSDDAFFYGTALCDNDWMSTASTIALMNIFYQDIVAMRWRSHSIKTTLYIVECLSFLSSRSSFTPFVY